MNMRRIQFLFLFFTVSSIFAQVRNNEWQLGIGTAVVKFSEEDGAFMGDRNLFQVPRLNGTIPLSDKFYLDGAMSFNTFDIGFISNEISYFSLDASVRYSFIDIAETFYPYVFAGASIVDKTTSERKMTPTFNIGAGATYWITDVFGLNTNIYYKHSMESFESLRSHIQITGGLVFALNLQDLLSGGGNAGSSTCYFNQH